MKLAPYILERLTSVNRTNGTADLLVPLLRELAKGRPVSRTTLLPGFSTGPLSEYCRTEQATSTEYDKDGNIIGYGLTLRETSYVFEIDDRRLYAPVRAGHLDISGADLLYSSPSHRIALQPEHLFHSRFHPARYRLSNLPAWRCPWYCHRKQPTFVSPSVAMYISLHLSRRRKTGPPSIKDWKDWRSSVSTRLSAWARSLIDICCRPCHLGHRDRISTQCSSAPASDSQRGLNSAKRYMHCREPTKGGVR